MISAENALSKINEKQYIKNTEIKTTSQCQGFILAEDIISKIKLPHFDNSAVDGFCVSYSIAHNVSKESPKTLKIKGIIEAGNTRHKELKINTTFHIMTGAIIPKNCDAIIMQENVEINNNSITFTAKPKKYQNIRFSGEDIKINEKIIDKGTKLKSNHIGLLLALGILKIKIYKKPKIAIISTGSELIMPGKTLKIGQVYYSNGEMIKCLIENFGGNTVKIKKIKDNFKRIESSIKDFLQYDMLIVIGGISIGKYDFVKKAFDSLGVKKIFHKGTWRPGKPLFFGDFNGKPVFGLPGNPVAAYITSIIFIQKCLNKMQGAKNELKWQLKKISHDFDKKSSISKFVQVEVNSSNEISILKKQASHKLGILSKANAISWIDDGYSKIKKGTLIKTIMIV